MRYIGPPALKKTIREAYEIMRADYPRTDIEEPILVVGPVETVRIKRGEAKVIQDPRKISEIDKIFGETRADLKSSLASASFGLDGSLLSRDGIQRRLRRISDFDYLTDAVPGAYALFPDAIFLRALGAIGLYVSKNSVGVTSQENTATLEKYVQTLRHELTHWDIATTTPHRELRKLVLEKYEGQEIEASVDVKERDEYGLVVKERIEKWAQETPTTAEFDSKVIRVTGLGITLLNEALAYAVQGADENRFNSVASDNTSGFIPMFRYFIDRIRRDGVRPTIDSAKTTIEESWQTDRKVVEILDLAA